LPTEVVKAIAPSEVLARFASGPLDFTPGTCFEYSNTDYLIAGMIIEHVSGRLLNEFLTAHIFPPL
jgi:CubicO group peptidase (beta-lactamase class C family)